MFLKTMISFTGDICLFYTLLACDYDDPLSYYELCKCSLVDPVVALNLRFRTFYLYFAVVDAYIGNGVMQTGPTLSSLKMDSRHITTF